MLYAVVDIETTGGYAASHGITEIAIVVHDGVNVIDIFETLINPLQEIPTYIQSLTGITNEMVAEAPTFKEVANQIFNLLKDKIFVAHNVNFDYSFVRHHLQACGHQLTVNKLCTVRLSRKILPGYKSYSLGKLCQCVGINIQNRHRAMGDASATATLLAMLLAQDQQNIIKSTLKKTSKDQVLPPNLDKTEFDALPNVPGVYYFKDQKGKTVYVGKAKQLKKRVSTHFSGNSASLQRQNFLKSIYHIDFETCGTELMALILEAKEIKRLWPENNRAMKRFEQKYSIYLFEDQNGYLRLAIDKFKKFGNIVYSFNNLLQGHQLLRTLASDYFLCEKLCFMQRPKDACTGYHEGNCQGACIGHETPEEYNQRVNEAIEELQQMLPSFAIIDNGRNDHEQSCILVQQGKLYGMGYLNKSFDIDHLDQAKDILSPFPSNDYVMGLIYQFAKRYPTKLIDLKP